MSQFNEYEVVHREVAALFGVTVPANTFAFRKEFRLPGAPWATAEVTCRVQLWDAEADVFAVRAHWGASREMDGPLTLASIAEMTAAANLVVKLEGLVRAFRIGRDAQSAVLASLRSLPAATHGDSYAPQQEGREGL